MGSSAHDVLQSLGDALAGVNRNTEFMKGEELGATVDEKRAQTDSAMANARHQRAEAEVSEALKARNDRLDAMKTAELTNPETAPIGLIIASGHGADFSGAMEGRLRGQEYNLRSTISTPPPLGDDIAAATQANVGRSAAEDALAPASAIAGRDGGRGGGAPIIGYDEKGNAIYYTPKGTPVRQPGAGGPGTGPTIAAAPRPVAPQPTSREKDTKFLISLGIDPDTAARLNYPEHDKDTPEAFYNTVFESLMHDPVLSNPDKADAAARRAVENRYGANAAAVLGNKPPLVPHGSEDASLPEGIPQGSKAVGQTRSGGTVYELPNGKRVVAE